MLLVPPKIYTDSCDPNSYLSNEQVKLLAECALAQFTHLDSLSVFSHQTYSLLSFVHTGCLCHNLLPKCVSAFVVACVFLN